MRKIRQRQTLEIDIVADLFLEFLARDDSSFCFEVVCLMMFGYNGVVIYRVEIVESGECVGDSTLDFYFLPKIINLRIMLIVVSLTCEDEPEKVRHYKLILV